MKELSKKAGIPRESLYQILSDRGNPRLDTLMRILDGLGLNLSITESSRMEESEHETHEVKEPAYA
ncbi:DNA-binding protein [Alloscardovia venturai]|uniref:DNA-binding protein n=1 Tax=Alloscardovia venturai TaxID=1769421 RepID=A0ABW2Y6Z9_9BIFI